jgi:hypothetical protein
MLKKTKQILTSRVTHVVMAVSVFGGLGLGYLQHVVRNHLNKNPAIIQIGGLTPNCSAFVVSNKYAITAKHCVVTNPLAMMLGVGSPYTPQVTVFKNGSPLQIAEVIWNTRQVDVVALKGNFKNYHHLNPQDHEIHLSPKDSYQACGFPYGTPKMVCSDVQVLYNMKEAYAAIGYITYGFSGGPVINANKNKAVGVNSAISEGFMLFTPLVAIKEMLQLEEDL